MNETLDRQSSTSFTSKLFYWLPPLLWMGAIFIFSTDLFSVHQTGGTLARILRWIYPEISQSLIDGIQFIVRKSGHFTVYAILAALWMRAFRSGSVIRWNKRWAIYSLLIVAVYSLLDEYHQSFTSFRTASIYDSLIDTVGGTVMICFWWLVSLKKGMRSTRAR